MSLKLRKPAEVSTSLSCILHSWLKYEIDVGIVGSMTVCLALLEDESIPVDPPTRSMGVIAQLI